MVADWKPEMLTVYASTQGTASVREEFAGYFKLPKTKVRVITEFMGGGFGAKFGAGNPGVVAAALSRRRPERPSASCSTARRSISPSAIAPAPISTSRIGAKKDGTLTAIQLISYGTAGCGTGAGMRRSGHESVQVRRTAHRGVRRLHQRRPRRGVARARTSPGSFRSRAVHRRTRREDSTWTRSTLREQDRRESRPARSSARSSAKAHSGNRAIPRQRRSLARQARHRSRAVRLVPLRQHGLLPRGARLTKTARSKCSPPCRTSAAASRPCSRRFFAEQFGVPPAKVVGRSRRHELPGRARLRRQHDHAFAHARGARRRLAGHAEISRGRRSRTRRARPI